MNIPLPEVHIRQLYRLVYSVEERQYSYTFGFDPFRKTWKFPGIAATAIKSVRVAMDNAKKLDAIEPGVGRIFFVDSRNVMSMQFASAFYVGQDYLLSTSDFNLSPLSEKELQDLATGASNENDIWVKRAKDSDTRKTRSSQLLYYFTSLADGYWNPSKFEYSELQLVGFTNELALFKIVKRVASDPVPSVVFTPAKQVPLPKDSHYAQPEYAVSVISYPSPVNKLQAMGEYGNLNKDEQDVVPNPLLDDAVMYYGRDAKTISPGYLIKEIDLDDFVNVTMTCFVSYGSCGGVAVMSASPTEFVGIVVGGFKSINANILVPATSPQVPKLLNLIEIDKKTPGKGIIAL